MIWMLYDINIYIYIYILLSPKHLRQSLQPNVFRISFWHVGTYPTWNMWKTVQMMYILYHPVIPADLSSNSPWDLGVPYFQTKPIDFYQEAYQNYGTSPCYSWQNSPFLWKLSRANYNKLPVHTMLQFIAIQASRKTSRPSKEAFALLSPVLFGGYQHVIFENV